MSVIRRLALTRWFIPATRRDIAVTILAGLSAGSIALARRHITSDEFIMDAGLGLLFAYIGWIMVGVIGAIVILSALILYASRHAGYSLPIVLFLGGSLLALLAPLPPVARGDPLSAQRMDYEAVVQLAQQHRLVAHPSCARGYELPVQYQDLAEACVIVIEDPALAMVFNPPRTHRLLIYAATEAALERLMQCCLPKGSMVEQADRPWYLFTPAQD